MSSDTHGLRERSGTLIRARKWSIGIVAGVFGLAYVGKEAVRVSAEVPHWSEYCYLSLLFTMFGLVGLWIYTSEHEMEIMFESLKVDSYHPPSDFNETLMIAGIGIVAAALLISTRAIQVFATLYFYYLLIDHGSWAYRLRQIHRVLRDARDQTGESLIEPIDAFYLKRPHVLRVSLLLAFAYPAAVLAWTSYLRDSKVLAGLAYAAFSTIIIFGEVPLSVWRQRFYAAARTALAEEGKP